MERLAREVPNIVGMKDSSGDMTQTEEFIRRTSDIGFKVLEEGYFDFGQWSMGGRLCGNNCKLYTGISNKHLQSLYAGRFGRGEESAV